MNRRGFSLMEILMATLLAAVVAAGMMAALVASTRITHKQNASTMSEAGGQSQELMEGIRTKVGADAVGDFLANGSGAWTNYGFGADKGQESSLAVSGQEASGQYKVQPADCDGDGNVGDCYAVTVRACWDGSENCT